MKRALITGIAGQDGSYLAELLIENGYEVHGIVRPGSGPGRNIEHIIADSELINRRLFLLEADIEDREALKSALGAANADEVYHLAGQSHVGQSFENVEATCHVTGFGTLRILDLVRQLPKPPRFFHASSSEIFGNPEQVPQDEATPIAPATPYGCAKAFGTQITRVYRQTFGLFAVNGILFNHESPRRGPGFVTQKICRAAAAIKTGQQSELVLGDTSAQRDWGDARDYVRGMWLSLQHETPQDYVFSTGKLHSVQDVVEIAFAVLDLDWRACTRQDPKLFRPADPRHLVGSSAKAHQLLKWSPTSGFRDMIADMVHCEMKRLQTGRHSS
ncbi:MAG TPA: GDP-mannose 4,6-dehydratase [Verrucomicrobiae bacterium]|nr:GDP-mannose 4,6-dehydratase [Verrucomicrobiae bacterium]